MTVKTSKLKRVISIFLCISLFISILPIMQTSAATATEYSEDSDPSTINGWKDFFLPESEPLSTENAGGVWTDKSVFTDAQNSLFADNDIEMTDTNSQLVTLSAIASNMTITGHSKVATDTILVLDVSGSMGSRYNNVGKELVDAANAAITTLMGNPNNRVGVVLYSDSSSTILPLDHYTTTDEYGRFLNYSFNYSEIISVNNRVRNSNNRTPSGSRYIQSGTYIQSGIITAMNNFTSSSNDPTEGGVTRKPVMVLLSDGAPTFASSNYYRLNRNMGNGEYTFASYGFVTQLTASYAKNKISEAYGQNCLFYTLALALGNGSSDSSIALSVLNPDDSVQSIKDYWTRWNTANVDDKISLGSGTTVTKTSDPLTIKYVNRFFNAETYKEGEETLQDALGKAFAAIVAEIELQSAYSPTLIQESEDFSGYVSFVDKIGKYMEVSSIKGILVGDNTLFSGKEMAKSLYDGSFGTAETPTDLGNEFVWAVMERLGLSSSTEARALINLAYSRGQLFYDETTGDFSNYIGWYANAKGEFLGFWYDDITTMPNPDDPSLTDETRPQYIMKSYGYLGEANTKSDMMYAIVQVREDIKTGEQTVTFGIPSSLLPVITYQVALNEDETVKSLTAEGEKAPIRLVYEVALKDEINSFTVKDIVSEEYLNVKDDEGELVNVNSEGSINFYTNQYETNADSQGNFVGYGKVNSYSYFRPSRENDRFYYQNESLVYADTNGTVYEGEKPTGTKYREYTFYQNDNGNLSIETKYEEITAEALDLAERVEEGSNKWVIPSGLVRRAYVNHSINKAQNKTGTLSFSALPFADIDGYGVNAVDHQYVLGVTQGNNGIITVPAETGIKLTKTLAENATPTTEAFEFVLTNQTDADDNNNYAAYRITASGNVSETVDFKNGRAKVYLKAGETLYIGEIAAGTQIKVHETETAEYKLESRNQDTVLTVSKNNFTAASFENADRGAGTLTIAKEIEHPYGANYTIPEKFFEFTLNLKGIGTANASFSAEISNSTSVVSTPTLTTDENGNIKEEIFLKHDEQLSIRNIPAGTVATVVEVEIPTGFTAKYWDNLTENGDGIVEIEKDKTASVIVVNEYSAGPASTTIIIDGKKTLQNKVDTFDGTFKFILQEYNKSTEKWVTIDEESVTYTASPTEDSEKLFSFGSPLSGKLFTEAGQYQYRIIEEKGNLAGIIYDSSEKVFIINVTDNDLDGSLEISSVTSVSNGVQISTDNNVSVSFTNSYSNESVASAIIDLSKIVNNPSNSSLGESKANFNFVLYNEDGTPNQSHKTNSLGNAQFILQYPASVLDGATEKVFKYTLKEVIDEKLGWDYDDKVINLEVTVSDDGDGNLVAVITETGATVVNEDNQIDVSFTNTYTPDSAPLEIEFVRKAFSGREIKEGEFSFSILERGKAPETAISGKNTLVTDENGNYTVSFDELLVFTEVGTYFFDITETVPADKQGVTYDDDSYSISVRVFDDNGELKAVPTIVNNGEHAIFINSYKAKETSADIKAEKNLVGRDPINNEFHFTLKDFDVENNKVADDANIYYAGNGDGGAVIFDPIPYEAAGTYTYLLSEETAQDGTFGVKYDNSEYLVTVVIKDDLKGSLEVDSITYTTREGGAVEDNKVIFKNIYIAKPTSTQILGNKYYLEGRSLSDGEFSFKLTDVSGNFFSTPMVVQNNAEGTFVFEEFSDIEFNEVGTYTFTVEEINDGRGGVIFDDTVYTITITVTDNQRGQLVAEKSIVDDEDAPVQSISFFNDYEITGSKTEIFSGLKTLENRELEEGEFRFNLYKTDHTYTVEEGAEPYKYALNKEDESFTLQEIYTPEDVGETFYYVVKEEFAGQILAGVTYSSVDYKIAVSVEDDNAGGIKTTVKVDGDEQAKADNLNFTNTYNADPTSIDISGRKDLAGYRNQIEGEFSFEIYPAEAETFLPAGAKIQTAINKTDETFTFENVPLETAGRHYFLIKELNTGAEGVTYDNTNYGVIVEVADDNIGNLYVKGEIIIVHLANESHSDEEIVFTNIFSVADFDYKITVNKTVDNKGTETLEPFGFKFALEKDGEDPEIIATDMTGKAIFNLTFTEEDVGQVYTYKIYEINDGKENVKYSEDVHEIVLSIGVDDFGKIIVFATENEIDIEEPIFEFVNEYDYTPPTPPTPPTTSDRDLTLWFALMLISGMTVFGSAFILKKKNESE